MTKSAYRFLSNDRIEEHAFFSGHFIQTSQRINATEGPVLILHDTTEFAYHRRKPEDIGYISRLPINKRGLKIQAAITNLATFYFIPA